MQKIAGRRRAAHRLIASCHSPSEDPPSPMNDSATRPERSREKAMAKPATVSAAVVSGAAGGRVNGFLPQRSEAFALKRRVAVADLAAREERFQTVVGRAGQQHAAQD